MIEKRSVRMLLRNSAWKVMEEEGIARFPRPVFGRIPNFVGAEEAASRLVRSEVFRNSKVVKVNPDSPQRPVREAVLRGGKLLVMPTPRISRGFLLINSKELPTNSYGYASTISGAFKYGKEVEPEDLPEIDLIVTGSTVVSIYGERLGKGEGYSELEYGILVEYGKLHPNTPIVTTVHDVQVIDSHIPLEPWDFTVDFIFTPTKEVKTVGEKVRPPGILWEYLSNEKLNAIPLLKKLKSIKDLYRK
ncbi:MAG: 5-formyltetrahydrofolate cyclo-ligase [Sulfolobales archaeon]